MRKGAEVSNEGRRVWSMRLLDPGVWDVMFGGWFVVVAFECEVTPRGSQGDKCS
jgi:hypothetical protein